MNKILLTILFLFTWQTTILRAEETIETTQKEITVSIEKDGTKITKEIISKKFEFQGDEEP